MPTDAYTLRYLCEELNSQFKGGKVNRVTVSNNDELALTIYNGKGTKKLFISVNPGSPRIGIIEEAKEGLLTATNFCMQLRKHLQSAVISGLAIEGFDRIIRIDFIKSGEFSDGDKISLYVELMGRYSNIILTENGKVLGGNRGINMFDDGVRPLMVGKPYVFPPTNGKLPPFDNGLIEQFKCVGEQKISQFIPNLVQGFATLSASELEHRFTQKFGEYSQKKAKDLFDFLQEFLYIEKKPCVYEGQDKTEVFVYPYECENLDKKHLREFENLYQAEAYFYTKKDSVKEIKSLRERLVSVLNSNIKKVKKRLTAINAKIRDALELEDNKIKGELITANIYKLKGKESQIEVYNYYDDTTVTIKLDERLSPSKNAENYYKKYNKQKRTLVALKPQKEQAENELNYLSETLDMVMLSEDLSELIPLEQELTDLGLLRVQKLKAKKQKSKEFVEYQIQGFTVRAGRSNVENERVTFSADTTDVWLHVKDYQSSHLIIVSNGKKIPQSVIKTSAEICAFRSKCRNDDKVEVVYTERKNVKKIRGGNIGKVTYSEFNSIMVQPLSHKELIKE